MSKILISGGTGFIGSHLIPKLVEREHDVWSLERYVTGRYSESKNIKTVFGDLRSHFAVRNIIRQVQPDFVIHLAAISAVSYSYEHPNEVMDTNLVGTINLAESCLREVPNFKQFLFASTSETYGNQTEIPIKETATLYPNSPYAVAKTAATMYLEYMRDAYNFPITLCTPFNTYGRIKNRHFVTERILTQMLEGAKELRLGDPDPVRDLVFRDDHLNAYLTMLKNVDAVGEKVNFCTGKGYSIAELVSHCAEATGWSGEVVWYTIPKRPLDIDVLIGDNTKARSLGWTPKYDLNAGLKKTIGLWKKKLGTQI